MLISVIFSEHTSNIVLNHQATCYPLNSLLDVKHAVLSCMPKTACFTILLSDVLLNLSRLSCLALQQCLTSQLYCIQTHALYFFLFITFNQQPTKHKFIFLHKKAYRLEPFRGFYPMHVIFYLILHNLFCYFIAIINITFS